MYLPRLATPLKSLYLATDAPTSLTQLPRSHLTSAAVLVLTLRAILPMFLLRMSPSTPIAADVLTSTGELLAIAVFPHQSSRMLDLAAPLMLHRRNAPHAPHLTSLREPTEPSLPLLLRM